MADRDRKAPGSIEGRYYVDRGCIDCALCPEIAPDIFRSDLVEGYVYVFRQPESPEDKDRCREAMDICPVAAIGDDGDES